MFNLRVFLVSVALIGQSQPSEPQMPDWRSEFTKYPAFATKTVTWSCSRRNLSAEVRIASRDVGDKIRNQTFRLTLERLVVGGRPVARQLSRKIEADIGKITSGGFEVSGRCRAAQPALEISGFSYDGTKYRKVELRYDLVA